MQKEEYIYDAYVVEVYDGDSITADIDLGFGVLLKHQKIRLLGINTPEISGEERPAGIIARDWLRENILYKKVIIKTYLDKKEKYGRWLAEVYIDDMYINETLVQQGLATVYLQ